MKIAAKTKVEVTTVRVSFPIRYPEDFQGGDDFPGRSGDSITMEIDINTGTAKGWPAGRTADIHEKVVDEGKYALLGPDGGVVVEDNDGYVPSFFPGDGYGDYIIFNIGADGVIAGWAHSRLEREVQEWADGVAER